MTTLKITPAKLNGSVCVPSSKSMGAQGNYLCRTVGGNQYC